VKKASKFSLFSSSWIDFDEIISFSNFGLSAGCVCSMLIYETEEKMISSSASL
jgi:hypothetical protein